MSEPLERTYALTKITKGDYLLPSNDGETVFRLTVGTEEEDGYETRDVWQVWRMSRQRMQWLGEYGDVLDWSEWGLEESWLRTRDEAIQAALRLSQRKDSR